MLRRAITARPSPDTGSERPRADTGERSSLSGEFEQFLRQLRHSRIERRVVALQCNHGFAGQSGLHLTLHFEADRSDLSAGSCPSGSHARIPKATGQSGPARDLISGLTPNDVV
jgi:hypothetical protein